MTPLLVRAAGFWLLFLAAALVLATFRELLLRRFLEDFTAHQVETVLLCVAIASVVAPFTRSHVEGKRDALAIGFLWFVLTFTFETLLGLLAGHSWSFIFADFDLAHGRLWPLVLLTLLVAPSFFVRGGSGAKRDGFR